MKSLGMSLAETVISIFLLLVGALACLELVILATRHQATSASEMQAMQLAEKTMDSIRRWAYDPHNYLDWSPYDNDTYTDPAYPHFQVQVKSSPKFGPISPNGGLEKKFAPDVRRLTDSLVAVKIKVQWGRGRETSLVSYVGEPTWAVRDPLPIMIQRIGGPSDPVPIDGVTSWTCDLYNSDGQAIPGVAFEWTVVPLDDATHPKPGNGWVEIPRQKIGREALVYHHFYNGDPALNLPPHSVGGSVQLQVDASYGGRPYRGLSAPMELQGP